MPAPTINDGKVATPVGFDGASGDDVIPTGTSAGLVWVSASALLERMLRAAGAGTELTPLGSVSGTTGIVAVDPETGEAVRISPGSIVSAGGGVLLVVGETPSGSVNGSNATFTTAYDFVPGNVEVTVNGLVQRPTTDFVTSGVRTIILADSPEIGDVVRVNYTRG